MPWAGGNQGREAVAVSGDGVDSTMWGPERNHLLVDLYGCHETLQSTCIEVYIYIYLRSLLIHFCNFVAVEYSLSMAQTIDLGTPESYHPAFSNMS